MMNKKAKIWLITATLLILTGLIIFSLVMTSYNWNLKRLSTVTYKENDFLISEKFSNISVNTETADITFLPSNDGKCMVTCYETEDEQHTATVKGDTLNINIVNNEKWYHHIGIILETPKITVNLPEKEYDSITLKEDTGDVEISDDFKFKNIDITTSTGDIKLENITADEINLTVSTGDIKLTDISLNNLLSNGSTGDISLNNVISKGEISIKRSTGDIKFNNCDSSEISLKTDTGDVTGSLQSAKNFITKTSTGDVNVPNSINGGKCEITTSTGDIDITVNP